jgi:uridine kinase
MRRRVQCPSTVVNVPIIIGVAGGSGSGKTTVVRRIVDTLGNADVTVLEHDRYYRDHPELRPEERAALNYDHPDSLETNLLVEHVQALKAGGAWTCPFTILHVTRVRPPGTDFPPDGCYIEGILIFADAELRALMDVKVFVDTDDDTRFIRRLQRDVSEQGRTVDSVIDQIPEHSQADAPGVRRTEQALRGRDRARGRTQPGGD